MGLSTVIDEMARANSRCFGATDGDMPSGAGMRHCEANSSRLPVRGETLSLGFFFELWKREFRFEGSHSEKFVFSDELKLAFKINSREFWEVLIRADRDLGNYLKDSIELLNRPASAIHGSAGTSASMPRDLPQAISLNLRLNGSSPDDKTVRLLREKLPYSKDNVTTHDIAKVCLQLFEVAHPADYDIRRLAEDLERENSIHRLNGEFTAIIPKKALDRFSTKSVLEFFKNKPLASAEASAMERGIYTVTEVDILLASQQGSDAFWQSIIPDKTIRERTLNMWKLAGMDSDARKFAKGKQILIATERALSDALHKHSAEMREIYPLFRQAGVSTQDADKFMAMLYLCHDFYKGLANVYINTEMLAHFGAPAARRLWDTIKNEGLKQGGIGKIKSSLETETERLNREVKEAIANRTAKIKKIELKEIDVSKYEPSRMNFDAGKIGLSQMVLMMREEYQGPAPAPEISRANQENLKHGYYVLSEEEKGVLKGNNGDLRFLWDKIGRNQLTLNAEAREGVRFKINQWEETAEISKIFVVHDDALNHIVIIEKSLDPISYTALRKLKIIICFANYLGAKINKAVITSTLRTAEEQADIMIKDYFSNPTNTLYPGSRTLYFKILNDKKILFSDRAKIAREALITHIKNSPKGFPHVIEHTGNAEVFDVGPNSSGINGKDADMLNLAMKAFTFSNYISPGSLPYSLLGDQAFHFVISS